MPVRTCSSIGTRAAFGKRPARPVETVTYALASRSASADRRPLTIERVLPAGGGMHLMRDRFLTRQLAQLGFVANALRPLPGAPVSFPVFFSGWLTTELSPHLLGLTTLDTAAHVARHGVSTRRDALSTALAAAN